MDENAQARSRDASQEGLQFDRAEFADIAEEGEAAGQQALACAACRRPITDAYYEIGGHIACPSCHDGALAAQTGGSGVDRFLRALVFGSIAGAVGFAIYYAVLTLTGYQVGLIAVVVGYLVGAAVRFGSQQRGGWRYQLLAVGITYISIVSTFVPMLLKELDGMPVGEVTMGYVGFLAVVLALPFLAGFKNILGLLILGFAVYQAWSLNKRVPFEAAGPFRVGVASTET
jgi:hypothetical protein